jgi:hypothetical protein
LISVTSDDEVVDDEVDELDVAADEALLEDVNVVIFALMLSTDALIVLTFVERLLKSVLVGPEYAAVADEAACAACVVVTAGVVGMAVGMVVEREFVDGFACTASSIETLEEMALKLIAL